MPTCPAFILYSRYLGPKPQTLFQVYMPYFLYSKKRYAGQVYTRPDKPDKVDVKGLQVMMPHSPVFGLPGSF